MNVFTTPAFLETAGALFFPGRRREVVCFELEGRVLRLLVLDGRQVVETMPFYDFPQPLDGPVQGATRPLAFFPRTVVATTTVEARAPEAPGQQPSPYIDWRRFDGFEAFEAFVGQRSARRFGDTGRLVRKLEREVGKVAFVFDDARPEVFEACVRWKSAQYLSSGLGDMFARPENVELFRRLRLSGEVKVSSYWAGETLLAAHLGSHHEGRLGWWIPAYDPKWQRFSPGRLLLTELMRHSCQQGDREFDFLIGDEGYKFQFATHNRVIGPVGTPPLSRRVLALARGQAKAVLARAPKALALARAVRDRLSRPGF